MPLEPGSSLGSYTVAAKIGEGGMGEVYRARDTKLDRDVALKVLPEAFTRDPDRLARFEREAKVLASLNHTNIAGIYGLEESGHTRALVLELVEGPTLTDRIADGPLPVDEALPVARQIAEALEAAHEQGVIHRDLKPANVKVRPDGTVKVLDFGLAKALAPEVMGDPALSPTLTAAATQMGVVMGTAAYMAPEQAKGQEVDRRADLWAFGVVLLEMLTGQQAFPGPTVSESLAKVLERGADLTGLPPDTPEAVSRLLRRCLTRDRRERLQHAGDARIELTQAIAHPEGHSPIATEAPQPARPRLWQIASIVALALGVAYAVGRWTGGPESTGSELRRLALPLGVEQVSLGQGTARRFAISPDGETVVFGVDPSLGEPLYRRDLTGIDTVPILGTEGGEAPFFSPDGRWVGFYLTSETTLLRVSLAGGLPEPIAGNASTLYGASWGPDDTIVFATFASRGLSQVAASGGTAERITTADDGELHLFPHHLPGGERLLFAIDEPGELPRIAAVSADGGDLVELGLRGREPRYLAVGSAGYLVYGQEDELVAVPFDAETLSVEGVPVSVLAPVGMGADDRVDAAFATDGSAVALEPRTGGDFQPVWVDRDGGATPVGLPADVFSETRLSPDGRRVALSDRTGSLRVYDLDTNEVFTPDFLGGAFPRWSPDSQRIAFTSNRSERFQLFTVDVSSADPAVLLVEAEGTITGSWSSDGGTLYIYVLDPETNRDLYAYSFDDERISPLLTTPAEERGPMVSPDGGWLAYVSDTSGRFEVHVSSLPDFEVTRQVSRDGGTEPSWSAAGDELFYRSSDRTMVAIPFSSTPELSLGRPELLFRDSFVRDPFGNTGYDVASDGRFLMLSEVETASQPVQLQVVLGFADEVHRLVSEQQ